MNKILSGSVNRYELSLTGRTFIAYNEITGKDLAVDMQGIETLGVSTILNLLFCMWYSSDTSLSYEKFIDDEDLMTPDFVTRFITVVTDLFQKYENKDTKK
jgi:hypothetical protein